MDNNKPIPDYSSPAVDDARHQVEQARLDAEEREHREALETYNEWAFGERRPIASMFLRKGLYLATIVLAICFLPRSASVWVCAVAAVTFVVWGYNKGDRWPGPGNWVHRWFRWW